MRVPCASPVASAPWESSYSSPKNVKFDNSHHILFDTPRLAVRIRQKHVQACVCIIVSLPPAGVRAQGSISASYAKSCQSSRRCKYWVAESTESSNSIGKLNSNLFLRTSNHSKPYSSSPESSTTSAVGERKAILPRHHTARVRTSLQSSSTPNPWTSEYNHFERVATCS